MCARARACVCVCVCVSECDGELYLQCRGRLEGLQLWGRSRRGSWVGGHVSPAKGHASVVPLRPALGATWLAGSALAGGVRAGCGGAGPWALGGGFYGLMPWTRGDVACGSGYSLGLQQETGNVSVATEPGKNPWAAAAVAALRARAAPAPEGSIRGHRAARQISGRRGRRGAELGP